ncbi:DUF2631 domain-containing protein [Mycobacterium sp. SMC-4]|uniref:DUF2631 domain-containing protein n=1 Tax=Mycobacterium sp. SMC-4 TaxID=2857059 RepID=UPI0021B4BDC2|nr:DUF2631 domain-containing protein [Mycobacterium sp. SMC-4]UXA19865.1 DUF2631 domain-containing protein [Mycobacterium sp. SMC-4]
MASTEVERRTGVDVEEVPSAEWGWSSENPRFIQIGGLLGGAFLLLMIHGNHVGRVEDWFMVGFAALVFAITARHWWVHRHPDRH